MTKVLFVYKKSKEWFYLIDAFLIQQTPVKIVKDFEKYLKKIKAKHTRNIFYCSIFGIY